jgi:hypothetical protein
LWEREERYEVIENNLSSVQKFVADNRR